MGDNDWYYLYWFLLNLQKMISKGFMKVIMVT